MKKKSAISILEFIIWISSGLNFWAWENNKHIIVIISIMVALMASTTILNIYEDKKKEKSED